MERTLDKSSLKGLSKKATDELTKKSEKESLHRTPQKFARLDVLHVTVSSRCVYYLRSQLNFERSKWKPRRDAGPFDPNHRRTRLQACWDRPVRVSDVIQTIIFVYP